MTDLLRDGQPATEEQAAHDLAAMLQGVADLEMQPLWTQTAVLLTRTPRVRAVPWAWRWSAMRPLAREAARLVPIDRGGERRVLALANPGLGGLPYATQTLWGALQSLGPRESAPAHRHTPGAIRFVLEGEGVWTLVDGDACAMAPGDLVLTPSWNWHEHHNPYDQPMLWFDGLDLPMVEYLDAVFFEDGDDRAGNAPVPDRSESERLFGRAGLRPDGVPTGDRHSPLLAYRWAETDATLAALQERLPGAAAVSLTFTDPLTGRDALPTMRCAMTRLRPGLRTASARTVGSAVLVCFRGSGVSVIDGVRIPWSAGDMVAVPSWAAVDHEATEPSDLFVVSDAPVVEALRLDRRSVLDHHQDVTSDFTGQRSAP